MARYGRSSGDDLAYSEDNRWDRERFSRAGRPEPPRRFFEEDRRFFESDRSGRRDVAVEDRVESRGPRGDRFEERDRIFRETYGDRPHRRSDRALFGDVDPREIANMAVAPYRGRGEREEDIEISIKKERRPGLGRRQSSLDTFDRRPIPRYDRDEYRMQPYRDIPLPIRRRDEYEDDYRGRDDGYREIEVKRERSVHRRSGKKSRATTVTSSSSSSSEETIEEKISKRGTSPMRNFKKGKTRMPKRLVRSEAIQDLGYPYVTEENFFVLQVALEKEQIDEVIKISETYKTADKHESFRYEEKIDESTTSASKTEVPERARVGREEIIRKTYINPPSDFLGTDISRRSRSHRRAHSPSIESSISQRSPARSRARSEFVEERKTVVEGGRRSRAGTILVPADVLEERKTIIEERAPSIHSGALIVQEREPRSDRDIQAEILRLEAERRSLRLERETDETQVIAIREERPERELVKIVERERSRERSPPRNVIRVEKDRKGRMALVRSAH